MSHAPRPSLWSRLVGLVEPIFRPLLLPFTPPRRRRAAPLTSRPHVESLEERSYPGETVLPLLWTLSSAGFADPFASPEAAALFAGPRAASDGESPPRPAADRAELTPSPPPSDSAGDTPATTFTASPDLMGELWLSPLGGDPFADPLTGPFGAGRSAAPAGFGSGGFDLGLVDAAAGGPVSGGAGSSGGGSDGGTGGAAGSRGDSAPVLPGDVEGRSSPGAAAPAPGASAAAASPATSASAAAPAEAPAAQGTDATKPGLPASGDAGVTDVAPGAAGALAPAADAPAAAPPRPAIRFERNVGQVAGGDGQAAFLVRGQGYGLFLANDADAVFVLQKPGADSDTVSGAVVRMDVVGANPAPAVEGQDELAGKSNYFRGSDPSKWYTDVSSYGRVVYRDVYAGIDLAYYGTADNQVEYDFIVAPGSDPGAIRLAFDGAEGVSLADDGSLLVHTAAGDLRQHAPVLYQELDGRRHAVAGHYELLAGGQVGFAVGAYDRLRPLVIDPVVSHSTYLGGEGPDEGLAIALDPDGNAYAAGYTQSRFFPTTTGAFDTTYARLDVFVTKFAPDGSLAYSTYLGEADDDRPAAIAVDTSGNAYVTGATGLMTYPTTSGAYQTTLAGGGDVFVTKLNAAGNALVYSTLLGGTGTDAGHAIAVDTSGNAHVAGLTASTDFPTTSGVYQAAAGGGGDAFITKLNSSGTAVSFSTYLGGSGNDAAHGLALDASGNVHVTGETASTNFPTASAAQSASGGGTDAFVAKLNSSGTTLSFSTYLGGLGTDEGRAIALDSSGNAYVTGQTTSSAATFPETAGAYQTALAGSSDAFVAKYSSGGTLSYATYLGGGGDEAGNAIAVTAAGEAVVAGTTSSTDLLTVDPLQLSKAAGNDAFVARLAADGAALQFSTYWGGDGDDWAAGIALDGTGLPLLIGTTDSSDFPVTAGAQSTALAGATDAFVTRLGVKAAPPAFAPAAGASGATGVRYIDGVLGIAAGDLGSSGFHAPWGHGRTWTNAPGYAAHAAGGAGVVSDGMPALLALDGMDVIAATLGGTDALFFDLVSTDYVARHDVKHLLTYDGGSGTFTLTDPAGGQWDFFDFDNALPVEKRGRFKSYTDPYGTATSVSSWNSDGTPAEVQRAATVGGDTHTESFLYGYVASGVNRGLIASVTLRRKVNAGSWSTVRKVDYTYYDGTTAHGNAGDLKYAVVKDASSNALDTSYYRYYKPGDSGGYAGGLKLAFGPAAYARLAANYTPESATDGQADDYADVALTYDSSRRVSTVTLPGAGPSSSGGLGTYSYSYTKSTNTAGYNSWDTRTVETLPDGNQNIVYSNAHGQTMLHVFKDVTTNNKWRTFYKYDGSGRLILVANPSAVTGDDDTYADLLRDQSGNYLHLADGTGLITLYDYYTSTTATGSTAGAVAGYLHKVKQQRGETGTAITVSAQNYYAVSANGTTLVPVANTTVYSETNETGGRTTAYAYTWFGSSAAVESMTVTLPSVSSGQNGPGGTGDTTVTFFDEAGRPIWVKDGDGHLHYTGYDKVTGAVTKSITDVDTDESGNFVALPSGWSSPSGLHLESDYEVDALGRATKSTDPAGAVTYTVYRDTAYEVRTYAGWDTTADAPTGPTYVYRTDRAAGYSETFTMTAAPTLDGSNRPTGAESASALQSLARTYTNAAGQVTHSDSYFSVGGLTYSTSTGLGTEGTHFARTQFGYGAGGRAERTQTPTGTIYRTHHDSAGRALSQWVGTDDTPTSGSWSPTNNTGADMVKVSEGEYDGGGVGDGNLTRSTTFPGGGAADRVTQHWYDWRNRRVVTKQGVEGSESTSVNRPLYYYELNNLGETLASERYDGDAVSITTTGGVPDKPSSSLLRARSTASYDDRGRVFRSATHGVDPSSGSVSAHALTTDTWYGRRGQVLKTATPGGVVTKYAYDGAGRVTVSYLSDGGGDSAWGDADDVTGDQVLEQVEYAYGDNINVTLVTTRQRFHDESGTGALGTASTGVKARVSYVAQYYDRSHRLTDTVDFGTYGGAAFTRPGSPAGRSDTALVTSYGHAADEVQTVTLTGSPTGGTFTLTFAGQTTSGIAYNASAAAVKAALEALSNIGVDEALVTGAAGAWVVRFAGSRGGVDQPQLTAASSLTGGTTPAVAIHTTSQGGDSGRVQMVMDPRGIVTKTDRDSEGRVVRTVRAFTNFVPTGGENETTEFRHDAAGRLVAYVAVQAGGGMQETGYVYNPDGSLAETRWPDKTTGAASATDKETYTVNALGERTGYTDRNGSTHTYTLDVLGRVTADAVTTLGSGVDGAILRLETAYDTAGHAYLFTSFDAAISGTVVNQVQRAFNGLGQLTTEWQAHGGAVNTSTSPRVQYTYSEMPSGANHSRLLEIIYPNGRTLEYNYASGLDADLSRLTSLIDNSVTLEEYSYLGLATVVKRAHAEPGVDLTYLKQGMEGVGDAGDPYTGLDRFGRVVDQRWIKTSNGTHLDRFQYAYDRNSNRLYRDNLVNTAFGELYHANGPGHGYDGRDQLTDFRRGVLSDTDSDTVLDTVTTASTTADWVYDELGNMASVSGTNRTHNQQNQATVVGAASLTYDAAGNMTTDELGQTYKYDAWDRVVEVKNSGGSTLAAYEYDALTRRVKRSAGGTTTDLYYSQDWQVLEERVGGNARASYVWSAVYVDALVARDRDSDANGSLEERLYALQDANYNVTSITNTSGAAQERYAYDPFGGRMVMNASWSGLGSSAFAWDRGHQGAALDGASGNYHLRNRDLRPTIGRWIKPDPIRFHAGDSNLYRYVNNRPAHQLDPSGLQGVDRSDPALRPIKLPALGTAITPSMPGGKGSYTHEGPVKGTGALDRQLSGSMPAMSEDAKFAIRALAEWNTKALKGWETRELAPGRYVAIVPNVDGQKGVVYYGKVQTTIKGLLKGDEVKESIVVVAVRGSGADVSNEAIFKMAQSNYDHARSNSAAMFYGYKATGIPVWRSAIHINDNNWEKAAWSFAEDVVTVGPIIYVTASIPIWNARAGRWYDPATGQFVRAPAGAGSQALDQLNSIQRAQQRIRSGSDGGRRIIDSIEGSEQTLRNQMRRPYDRTDWD